MAQQTDPIWRLIESEPTYSLSWLARKTGYTYMQVWRVKQGMRPATHRFRAACAMALNRPVEDLFLEEPEVAIA